MARFQVAAVAAVTLNLHILATPGKADHFNLSPADVCFLEDIVQVLCQYLRTSIFTAILGGTLLFIRFFDGFRNKSCFKGMRAILVKIGRLPAKDTM